MAGKLEPEAARLLDELVDVSRALGSDPRLVLHGGGNTSVKVPWPDVTGRERTALLVKGSGHDLAEIGRDGFAALDLARVRELLPPTELAREDLAGELRCAALDHRSPDASVESLVHALLPHTAVVHSHADALLVLTNTPRGAAEIGALFGDDVLVVDYAMSGPELGAACARAWADAADRHDRLVGIVVLNHGLFTFADAPGEALATHLQLVGTAEARVREVLGEPTGVPGPARGVDPVTIARLRRDLSAAAGVPLVVRRTGAPDVTEFLEDPALVAAAARGPITPDHVIWTRRVPLVGDDVTAYVEGYRRDVAAHARPDARTRVTATTDLAPRVVLHPEVGLLTAGRTAREATIAQDIARHALAAITASERLGGYRPAAPEHVFDLEFWGPQQEKLERASGAGPLTGQVAVVTGAASGIGRACAEALLAAGASVVGWDLSPSVAEAFDTPDWLGLEVDVTEPGAQAAAIARGVEEFGGLDVLVVSAGVFPTAQHLDVMDLAMWRRTMAINVDSVAELYGLAHPLLALAPGGGRVVVVASKNVAAPGPGAAAYSASKAALTQLSRVAALEWAADGVRVNLVHPDAVFDTALWTPELLSKRAAHYGMTVPEYKRRNLLRTEVTSASVARLVRAMADDTFAATTGAQVPVDGGNERVI